VKVKSEYGDAAAASLGVPEHATNEPVARDAPRPREHRCRAAHLALVTQEEVHRCNGGGAQAASP